MSQTARRRTVYCKGAIALILCLATVLLLVMIAIVLESKILTVTGSFKKGKIAIKNSVLILN